MPFIHEDGHLAKVFQQEKRDTASQLLTEFAKIDKFGSVW